MFFKKNKSNDQPIDPNHPSAAHRDPLDGASLFAPGLNPSAQPIDFGFGRVPSSPGYAYPEPPFSPEPVPSLPTPENSGWTPQFEVANPGFESHQAMPELLNTAELSAATQGDLATPLQGYPSAPGTGPSYLEETFENYTPNLPAEPLSTSSTDTAWESPDQQLKDDWSSGLESPSWFSPAQSGISDQAYSPAGETLNPQSDWTIPATGPLETSLDSGLGDLMPWEQLPQDSAAPAPSLPEVAWEQFDSGAALPGQQVPIESGAFLDSVHEKLYPEDPFAPGYDEFAQGQQAFEEAAQFLFPDTVSAPLDWQPDTSITEGFDPFAAQALSPENAVFIEPPLELGPSVQSDVSEVSDMTAYAPETFQPEVFQTDAPSLSPSTLTPEGPETAFPSLDDPWLSNDTLQAFDPFAVPPPDNSGADAFEGFGPPMDSPSPTAPSVTAFDPLGPDALDFDPFNLPPTGFAESSVNDSSEFERSDSTFELPVSELETPPMPGNAGSSSPLGPDALDFDPFSTPPTGFTGPSVKDLSEFERSDSTFELPVPELETPPMPGNAGSSSPLWPETAVASNFVDSVDPVDPFSLLSPDSGSLEAQAIGSELSVVSADEAGILWARETAAEEAASEQLFEVSLPVADASEAIPPGELSPAALDNLDEAFSFELSGPSTVESLETAILPDLSDQDFYATDFALNEFGELVPVEPEEAGASLSVEPLESVSPPMAGSGDMALPLSLESAEFTEAPLAQDVDWLGVSSDTVFGAGPDAAESYPSLSESPPLEAVSPFQRVSPPPIPLPNGPVSMPLEAQPMEEAHSPEQLFSGPLEAQWHDTSTEVTTSAIQPSQVAPPQEFSLSDIQILSVCPLFADRRLLVVSSNGIFALMGQVGLQQPQVAVLKLFENNPLAYQNTFTAVAEAHADSQGMFVTQVGTWRGIISTFQDKITLHTDLG